MFWRKRTDHPAEAATETAGTPAPIQQPQPVEATAASSGAMEAEAPGMGFAQLEGRVIDALSTVYDPEIPVNIYELGLIYDLHVTADNCVRIEMTLTSPACPVAGSLPGEVEAKVRDVEGVRDVALELVWDPPWTPDRMSEAARLELGFM